MTGHVGYMHGDEFIVVIPKRALRFGQPVTREDFMPLPPSQILGYRADCQAAYDRGEKVSILCKAPTPNGRGWFYRVKVRRRDLLSPSLWRLV